MVRSVGLSVGINVGIEELGTVVGEIVPQHVALQAAATTSVSQNPPSLIAMQVSALKRSGNT